MAECARQEAEEKAKSAEKQARDEERQAEEKERQLQREQRGPDEPFVGALNSRKKADLQDIAYALGLNIEGRVEDLKSRINAYFDEHEPLRTTPRYIGLFPQLARQARQMPAQTSQTPSHSLRNITNTQPSNLYQHNHIAEHHRLTLDAQNQQAQNQILSPHISTGTRHRPPGPLNWPAGLIPSGYIAHNPPYYNFANANTSS